MDSYYSYLSSSVYHHTRPLLYTPPGRGPLCIPDYSETSSVDLASLKLTEIRLLLPPEGWC